MGRREHASATAAAPISIPVVAPRRRIGSSGGGDQEEEYSFREEEEWVPPHVLVSRRMAGKMPSSVCTGTGRTLKGRDLSHVRNAVLRLTGFLET